MRIKVSRVEPTNQVSASGKKKYYVYTADGDRYIAWGDWVATAKGKELDVDVKKNTFRGVEYSVLWPTKEAPSPEEVAVPSEIAIKSRPRTMAEPEVATQDSSAAATEKMPKAYWERRDQMMAKESALKSAAEVWSTRVSINPAEESKNDPLQLAKEFYFWIMGDR